MKIDAVEPDFHERLSRVLSLLAAAVTNTGLYSATHPQVVHSIGKAHATLAELLQQHQEITVLLIGNDLVSGNRPLPPAAASASAGIVRILKNKGIERISFLAGLPASELRSFLLDLASPDLTTVRATAFIKLGRVELKVRKQDGETPSAAEVSPDALQALQSLSASQLDELKDLYLSVKRHKKIDIRGVDEVVKKFIKSFRREINPLSLLASLKASHEYTFTHVTNVCILTMSQAEMLGFTGEHLHQIGLASLLHDVGKIFIPEEILSKPGALTPEERRVVETHTVKGARYLMGVEGIPKLAVLSALEHHLKYDGSGYPSLKGGWRPNIASQLISIADVFDAMRSRRSYQGEIPIGKIVEVLKKGSGTSFNPQLVDTFLKLIRQAN